MLPGVRRRAGENSNHPTMTEDQMPPLGETVDEILYPVPKRGD